MTTPEHAELTWRKSSHSNANNGDCVEVATTARAAAVRDSKDPAAGHLTLEPAAWRAFLGTVRR
ncbi:DUF397 domain-containing protein [Amycolatopsis cihanbeyliensis]|uniref:DUF397 domain-containing protein n=1 Tax=Amycolatopsis cihanbeyliensis TaxID=1128664 RepID=UPI001153617E|nr:DUF397 domain-containing protein [Amycolatopsis cihanbeyliensis]